MQEQLKIQDVHTLTFHALRFVACSFKKWAFLSYNSLILLVFKKKMIT